VEDGGICGSPSPERLRDINLGAVIIVRARPVRIIPGVCALILGLFAGCNNKPLAEDSSANIRALDELVMQMRQERDFGPRDEYVEKLQMIKAQLLAENAQRKNRRWQLEKMKRENADLRNELEFLKKHIRVEVKSIEIPFYSGGKDTDNDGKDDCIEATVCPKDAEGHITKAIGKCRLGLYRKSFMGVGMPGRLLMRWDFSYEDVNKAWVDRLFRGYTFTLRWKGDPPPVEDVVLEAVFTTLDGQEFVNRKKMKLRL